MDKQNVQSVAIYVRESGKESGGNLGVDTQLEQLRNYCLDRGKVVVGEYVDRDFTGQELVARPGLQQMLSDSADGQFEEVLVWKLDRLATKATHLLGLAQELKRNGIRLRSLSENFETDTPAGMLTFQMLAVVGELEAAVGHDSAQGVLQEFGTAMAAKRQTSV